MLELLTGIGVTTVGTILAYAAIGFHKAYKISIIRRDDGNHGDR